MVGLLFILGLVVVSGLVAYVGDNVGRKVGRAKMRLFGLRPKYTSIIVAIVTGMIITAITISTLLIFSKDVRIMLFQLEQLQDDLKTAQDDIEKVQQVLDTTSMQLDNTKTDLAKVEVELSDAEAVISSQDRDIILKLKLLDEAQAEYDSLVVLQEALDEQITSLGASLSTVRTEVTDLNSQLGEKERLINLRTSEIGDLESQRNQIADKLSDLKIQTDQLVHDIAELETAKENLGAEIDILREGGVKVFRGEIVQEFTISTSLSDAEIIKKILGAKLQWDTEDPNNEHGNPMAEPTIDQYTDVINQVNRYKDKYGDDLTVIRIIASEHIFENEVVSVNLKVVRHLRVFRKGEILAQRRFTMEDHQSTIRNGLIEMLQALEQEALVNGMIFEGLEDAVWADPTVIVEMARKASFYPNDIYINLVAKRDIFNIEYLSLAPEVPEIDNMMFVIVEIEPESDRESPP